jgi:lipopolysaccharide export system protein LptA
MEPAMHRANPAIEGAVAPTPAARVVALARALRAPAAGAGLALLAALPLAAHGERADREKAANVTADHSTLDDLHQVQVLTGHVVLIKGTMRLGGERMEHRQDEQGYQYYIVNAAPGELASFHERRDPVREGVESTIDGYADRIDYDDRTDKVILTGHALVKRFENGEQRDELSGTRIVYDARKSNYDVDGRSPDGGGSRVHITIAPRAGAAAPAPARPAPAGAPVSAVSAAPAAAAVPAGSAAAGVSTGAPTIGAPQPAGAANAPLRSGAASAPAVPAGVPGGAAPAPGSAAIAPASGAPATVPAANGGTPAVSGKPPLPPIPPPQLPDLRTERLPPEGNN